MRDRLIELLTDNLPRCGNLPHWDNPLQLSCDEQVERIADHLLANGVIVPPCKVGDTVYVISKTRVKEAKVNGLQIDSRNIAIFVNFECDEDCEGCPFEALSQNYCGEWDCVNQYGFEEIKTEDFGKTVFLTKEEAEQALKEREQV